MNSDDDSDQEERDVDEQEEGDVDEQEEEGVAGPDIQQQPEPLMGHRGEKWCNIDPANVVEGPRVRNQ